MDKLIRWLILKTTQGLGERKIKKLLEIFGSSEGIFSADADSLVSVIGKKAVDSFLQIRSNHKRIQKITFKIYKEKIKFTTLEDENYPSLLKNLPDPPPILFYKGNFKDTPLIGVVGPRNPNPYTLSFVEDTVTKLILKGYGIVSGGAKGVDSKAHLSAVERNGYTVCVLGFGILNTKGGIFERIEKSGGLLLSEFLPEERASKYTFPKRNRLISALSHFLIVPEAGINSGSLITARYAHDYGKKVFVHIGIGRSSAWDGCYALIKEGIAELMKNIEDVIGAESERDPLLDFLKIPRSVEEIMEFTSGNYEEVCSLLTQLEMEGKVKRIGSFFCS